MSKELTYKICLFGDRNVGKTELLQAYVPEMFVKQTKPPTSINLAIKNLTINSSKIMLQIWILGSELSFKFIFPAFTKGASGGIFMYDITKYSSLRNIEDWLIAFKESLSDDKKEIPILMVVGKVDLSKELMISRRSAKKVSKKYKIVKYFECSPKTGKNVDKIFEFLTRSILKVERYS